MPRPIVSFRRNLGGIINTLYSDPEPTNDDLPPSINDILDTYFKSHGYLASSIWQIRDFYASTQSRAAFAAALSGKGMAINEAEWIWDMWSCRISSH
jgi:hypothetical protein